MSTTTPTARRGRPKKKILKVRQNITIDPVVLKAAQKTAFNAGLALSTWLEQLIRERTA
jgi:predicted HicB family RNase H-like nuclease